MASPHDTPTPALEVADAMGQIEQDPRPAVDRPIGALLAELRELPADQVERVLAHQQAHGQRFGEAAVALGLVSSDDVLLALSRQFHYPYAPEGLRAAHPELVALNQPFGVQAEGLRAIRSQLMMRLSADSHQRRALAVVSPETGDGRSFLAANLAITLAQLGDVRVLLVDADLRRPRLHQVFGIDNGSGLSNILSGRAGQGAIRTTAQVPGLFLLPVGTTPPNPLELVERPAFGLLMRELLAKFDHVVLDTPAAHLGSDSAVLAARCGAALVVARRHKARMAALQALVASLANSPARLAGVVINEF